MGPIRNKSHNEMMNILAQFCMNSLGFPVGEIFVVTPTTGNSRTYWSERINESRLFTSIQEAYTATVTQRNDVILVAPENNTWVGDAGSATDTLTWSKQNVHMLGMSPKNKGGYGRARFSHSSTMVNMLTVSGSGNMFKNIRLMHGSASAGDITCLTVSGAGNVFDGFAVASPISGTQSASANYLGTSISGTQNSFLDCTFGTANDIDRSGASCMLNIVDGCGAWNVFENCIWRSRSGGGQATAYFINCKDAGTVVDYPAIFLNNQFLHQGTALTLAMLKTDNTARRIYFDARCTFAGVGDIIAAAQEAQVYWGSSGVPASNSTTAPNDRLNMGIAATVDYS
jgi:hypothetical protein